MTYPRVTAPDVLIRRKWIMKNMGVARDVGIVAAIEPPLTSLTKNSTLVAAAFMTNLSLTKPENVIGISVSNDVGADALIHLATQFVALVVRSIVNLMVLAASTVVAASVSANPIFTL